MSYFFIFFKFLIFLNFSGDFPFLIFIDFFLIYIASMCLFMYREIMYIHSEGKQVGKRTELGIM